MNKNSVAITLKNLPLVMPSPLEKLDDPILKSNRVALFVKRDDLIHPIVQGNKWRKLKFNLIEAEKLGKNKIVTFGGAFSNHIYATAAACSLLGFESVGIIRGEKAIPLSPTLSFAEKCGMTLQFVSRQHYREKKELFSYDENYYKLPEGGSNTLAVEGSGEIVEEIRTQLGFKPNYFCVACGTGGTIAGIITCKGEGEKVVGVNVLKNVNLVNDIENMLEFRCKNNTFEKINKHFLHYFQENLKDAFFFHDYSFGGYAKWTPELIEFINDFKRQHNVPLDPVYTGKLFYGVFDLIKKGFFPPHSTIVVVHTGGLQGIEGFNDFRLKGTQWRIE